MSATPAHPYRLSDTERDEAISVLGDAYAEGRLTTAEFDERLEAASSARFASDLDVLFADLPPRPRPRTVAAAPPRPTVRRPRPPLFLVPVAVLIVLILVGQAWLLIPLGFFIVARTMPRPPNPAPWGHHGRYAGRRCGRW